TSLAADSHSGLHDLRAQARLRDRVPVVPALPDHRSRGGIGADVDGHDDAAARGGVAAVQADLLRAGGRLEPGCGLTGAELRQRVAKAQNDRKIDRPCDAVARLPGRADGPIELISAISAAVHPPARSSRSARHWASTLS